MYQIKYKAFEAACEKGFKKRSTGSQEALDWPIDRLVDYMTRVMRANGQTRKGYHPRWSVIMARLVDIYRDEMNRLQAIDSWNHKQEMEALLADLRGPKRDTHDEYEDGVE